MANANTIGTRLVELCRQGKNAEAIESLYADDVVSVEAAASPPFPAKTSGKSTALEKNAWFAENHEIHGIEIAGPYPHGDRFAVRLSYDVTSKPSGQRMQMDEIAVYTVSNGKIVREEFFYDMGQ